MSGDIFSCQNTGSEGGGGSRGVLLASGWWGLAKEAVKQSCNAQDSPTAKNDLIQALSSAKVKDILLFYLHWPGSLPQHTRPSKLRSTSVSSSQPLPLLTPPASLHGSQILSGAPST